MLKKRNDKSNRKKPYIKERHTCQDDIDNENTQEKKNSAWGTRNLIKIISPHLLPIFYRLFCNRRVKATTKQSI